MNDISHMEVSMGDPTYANYHVLAHFKKLPIMINIYDAQSLVKALLKL